MWPKKNWITSSLKKSTRIRNIGKIGWLKLYGYITLLRRPPQGSPLWTGLWKKGYVPYWFWIFHTNNNFQSKTRPLINTKTNITMIECLGWVQITSLVPHKGSETTKRNIAWRDNQDYQFQGRILGTSIWDYGSILKEFKGNLRTIWSDPYNIETCYDNGIVKIRTIYKDNIPSL
jgi:hypothetical protein